MKKYSLIQCLVAGIVILSLSSCRKQVVNFGCDGDSITAGDQWSATVAADLGVTTHHNVGMGTATWAAHDDTQEYGCEGFVGISMWWLPTDDPLEIRMRHNNCAIVHVQKFIAEVDEGQYPEPELFGFAMGTNDGNPGMFLVAKKVQGNTTFASGLAAFYNQIAVGHVEAGLRTYDIYAPYPEEFNRQAIDSIADVYFAPTEESKQNLIKEGKPENKIYVTGNTFDDYLSKDGVDSYWESWEANYRQKGKDWERDGYINVFDNNGNLKLSKNTAVRVRGGFSRAALPKSLNLYALSEDGKKENFDYCFFDNDYNPKAISLNAGGNQTITQLSDYLISDRTGNLNVTENKFGTYVLFINGEYWGFYWLSEKYDEDYFSYYYNVDSFNVIMIKNREVEIGEDNDIEYYYKMINYINNNDMNVDENYNKACELIDIDSYIDYYAMMAGIDNFCVKYNMSSSTISHISHTVEECLNIAGALAGSSVRIIYSERHYNVEVRFHTPESLPSDCLEKEDYLISASILRGMCSDVRIEAAETGSDIICAVNCS